MAIDTKNLSGLELDAALIAALNEVGGSVYYTRHNDPFCALYLINQYGVAVVKFHPPVDGDIVEGQNFAALSQDDTYRRDGANAEEAIARCFIAWVTKTEVGRFDHLERTPVVD